MRPDPQQSAPQTVHLLSSGWASDDQYEHGVFSSVEAAKAAAPADLEWIERPEPRGTITHEAYSKDRYGEDHPWWIEGFVLDQAYAIEKVTEGLADA